VQCASKIGRTSTVYDGAAGTCASAGDEPQPASPAAGDSKQRQDPQIAFMVPYK
jgi:hypothetical protein